MLYATHVGEELEGEENLKQTLNTPPFYKLDLN